MVSIGVDPGSPASVQRSRLLHFKEAVGNFLDITRSCRTPGGKIKILQNASGGNLTLTSSSKRLFQSLSVRKPIIQLLVTATQGHLGAYSDGGLFLATFAAKLVLKSIDSSRNPKILAEVYEVFLTLCLEYLKSTDCTFKHVALMSDIKFMKSFVRSILESKPLCGLDDSTVGHLSKIILETFLQSVSEYNQSLHGSENVFTVATVGVDVLESRNLCGIILPSPELSRFKILDIEPKYEICDEKTCIRVALITVSLSGDLDELSQVNYEARQDIDMDNEVLEGLSDFCESLVQSNVGLVLCQKVIHPQLKISLRQARVIAIDRIGLQSIKYITKLTGCLPIQRLDDCNSDRQYGYIDKLQHIIINKKSYLHLTRADNPVSTLMLYHQHEEPLNELRDVCITSLDSLWQLVYNPLVLAGGGCWQVALATYLMTKVATDKVLLAGDLECPESLIHEAGRLFTEALVTAGVRDCGSCSVSSSSGHVFRADDGLDDTVTEDARHVRTCCCGMYVAKHEEQLAMLLHEQHIQADTAVLHCDSVCLKDVIEKRDVVVDGFTVCVNALQTAVLTACSILKIGQVVENL